MPLHLEQKEISLENELVTHLYFIILIILFVVLVLLIVIVISLICIALAVAITIGFFFLIIVIASGCRCLGRCTTAPGRLIVMIVILTLVVITQISGSRVEVFLVLGLGLLVVAKIAHVGRGSEWGSVSVSVMPEAEEIQISEVIRITAAPFVLVM